MPPFTVRGVWSEPEALSYRVDADDGPVPPDVFAFTVERALAVWSSTGCVRFERVDVAVASDIVFGWGAAASADDPDAPFGRDTSVAQTGPVGPGCAVLFDGSRAWTEQGGVGPSLYQAAVHEIGHALGLGHSPDRESVLYPQREGGRSMLGASDLAGLHTLYGGGEDGPGDLIIEREGAPALRRVAPPGISEWGVFDTDGDGDDEILVWACGEVGEGALTIYHFSAGPRLTRTVGPILGVAGPGTRLMPVLGNERYLEITRATGEQIRRDFAPDGSLRPPRILPGTGSGAGTGAPARRGPSLGDLDGDGNSELVRNR